MKNKLSWFAVPYVGWMALMVVIPILIMVVYAFTTAEFQGTLENFAEMGAYTSVFLRSFRLALVATLICLLIGYPVSYWMAHEGPGFQRVAMALIMLPMWMNFLLRTYSGCPSWRTTPAQPAVPEHRPGGPVQSDCPPLCRRPRPVQAH